MWKDTKYLLAYIAPLAGYLGIYFGGFWSLGSIYVGFVLIPLLELLLPGTTQNLTEPEEKVQLNKRFFDYLLYLNIPIHPTVQRWVGIEWDGDFYRFVALPLGLSPTCL